MRKWWLIAAIVIVVVAGIGWYFESPKWTLKQMANAAEARDSDNFSEYVDYPKLRESTKSQLKAAMTAEVAAGTSNGFEALGMMMGLSMVDNLVDGLLSPEGVAAMFAKQGALANGQAPAAKKPFGIEAQNREIVRDGFDRFRLHDKTKPGEDGDLVFERHGLGWKLAQIKVPTDLFSKEQNAESDEPKQSFRDCSNDPNTTSC